MLIHALNDSLKPAALQRICSAAKDRVLGSTNANKSLEETNEFKGVKNQIYIKHPENLANKTLTRKSAQGCAKTMELERKKTLG